MNPFEVLGVNHKSSAKDIDSAYRELAKKYHPDVNPDNPEAEKKFKEVQKAYELLNKKSSNNINFRTRKPPPDFIFGFDIFSNSSYKGRNIQAQVEIELSEVLTGCNKNINYKVNTVCKNCNKGFTDFLNCEQCDGRGHVRVGDGPFDIRTTCYSCMGRGKIGIKKCEKCKGQGNSEVQYKTINIDIPVGIESGMHLVFAGLGEESLNGGIHGDLIVVVKVKDHDSFKREGANLITEAPISYAQLCLGCELQVPSLTNEILLLKIPEECSLNTKFRIKGKGLFFRGKIGDLIVNLKLKTIKNITQEHKNVLLSLLNLENSVK
jgi:molecular chaperone DnaJ